MTAGQKAIDETLGKKLWKEILAMPIEELKALAEQRAMSPFAQALVDSGVLNNIMVESSEEDL